MRDIVGDVVRLVGVVAVGLLVVGCRPAPPPAPVVHAEPRGCEGSLVDGCETALDANLDSPFVCDPRPGAAGWIRPGAIFTPDPPPPPLEPAAPLDLRQPRFALVLDGRGVADVKSTLATLRAEADYHVMVASPGSWTGVDEHAPPTDAGVTALIASLRRRLAPGAVLVVVAAEVVDAPDDPWGCIPLVDGCLPLSRLGHVLRDIRTGARVVVLEQAGPRLAFAALADATTVVVTFPSGQAGRSAARAFWSARVPDRDRDGVVAVRERAEHARRLAPGVRVVDPLGNLSLGRRQPRARGTAPREVHDRPALDRELAALAPGEIAVVNLSTTWCAACKPFRPVFEALALRTGGPLRFIHAETDEQWDGFHAPAYPSVAFIGEGGRLLGVTSDLVDPLAALYLGQFEALEDRIAHHRAELRSRDVRVRARAARAIVALGPPGVALVDDLARDLHDETASSIVLDILQALGSYGDRARDKAPELLALFDHPGDGVRAFAVHTLHRIDADVRPIACPLVSLVADPSSRVREAVIGLLAAHPDALPPLLPALRVVMEDRQPAVRSAALAAFRRLSWGDAAADALPTLLRLVTPGEPDEQRAAAIAAIVDLGPRAAPAVADLARLLTDPDAAIRRQAALALGNCGPAASCAAAELAALERDPDPHTRRKAAWARTRINAATANAH